MRSLKDLQKNQKQQTGSIWARNKVSRFKKDILDEVGPGRYTIDCRKKSVAHRGFSVGFASKTVRRAQSEAFLTHLSTIHQMKEPCRVVSKEDIKMSCQAQGPITIHILRSMIQTGIKTILLDRPKIGFRQ